MFNHSKECTALLVEPQSSRAAFTRFLLVSIVDVEQDPLLFAYQFHPFQGTHCNELWSKEDYVLVV